MGHEVTNEKGRGPDASASVSALSQCQLLSNNIVVLATMASDKQHSAAH